MFVNFLRRIFGRKVAAPFWMREGNPDFDLPLARKELTGRNLAHGLRHLANVLELDPNHSEGLELLRAYRQRAGGTLAPLIPTRGDLHYGMAALLAWDLHASGQREEAWQTMLSIANAKWDAPYLEAWGKDWLDEDRDLSQEFLLMVLGTVMVSFPEFELMTYHQRLSFQAIAEHHIRLLPMLKAVPAAQMVICVLLRKAGRGEEGLRLAQDFSPSWQAWIARALLLKQLARIDEAVEAFAQARAADPSDLSAYVQAAEMLAERDRWSEASELCLELLSREPSHPATRSRLAWCRWQEAGCEPPEVPELIQQMAGEGDEYSRQLLLGLLPYWGRAAEPRDAMANWLREAVTRGELPSEFSVELTDVEAPSNLVAVRVAIPNCQTKLRYLNVSSPDPREPVQACEFSLWRRQGEVLVPAFEPPDQAIREKIEQLAVQPYHLRRWWAQASRLGCELGIAAVSQLLACLTWPGHCPATLPDPLVWTTRSQTAATFVLANLDSGWEGSLRRRVLFSLLFGPRDWTTESAILALCLIAQSEPLLAWDIHHAFQKLDGARPQDGFVCYEKVLLEAWQQLPCLHPSESALLARRSCAVE